MKKSKILFILLLVQLCLCLSGCREYGEKRIVKLLSITEKEVSILFYNYDGEKVQYDKISQKNDGIQNTIVDILKKERFDLKLCQYCFIDENILENQTTDVFLALNNSKFSPDINLVCTDNFDNMERYLGEELIVNPIYNLNYKEGKIDAAIPFSGDIKYNIIIKDGKKYNVIDDTQATLLNILTNQNSNYRYNFSYEGKNYSADLENAVTGYGVKNDALSVEIFARLISYSGMSAGENNKKNFTEIMKRSIEKQAKEIYADKILIDQYNLFWYKNVKMFSETEDININIIIQ